MPTAFPDRTARANAAIARTFGELFDFLPIKAQADVNLPPVEDSSRTAQLSLTGVWEGATKTRTTHARGSVQDDTAPSLAVTAPSVSVADADFVGWVPVNGDLCRRQLDGSVYRISSARPDGFGRTVFKLTTGKRS